MKRYRISTQKYHQGNFDSLLEVNINLIIHKYFLGTAYGQVRPKQRERQVGDFGTEG